MEKKNEIKEEKEKKKEKEIKENNKENKNKQETNKIKEKNDKEIKQLKRPSAWIFLEGDNLFGFHLTFVLMIVIPISTFFIVRNILRRFNFSENQQNVFGVISVLISVWVILISYIVYYFRNDFYTVFCKKRENEKEEEKEKEKEKGKAKTE